MFNWMLEIVNGGVIDNPSNGNGSPDGVVNSTNPYLTIYFLIVFVIGVLIGFGIRHLIQIYKNIPKDENQKGE